MAAIDLRELGPDDADAIEMFVAIDNAVRADAPWEHLSTPYRREMTMRHGWDGDVGRHFLAYAGADPVGLVVVNTSDHDNLDLAWILVAVHPEQRRIGHGRAVLAATYDICRKMGRPLLGAGGWDNERTTGFAAATGFVQKSVAVNRRQHLGELEPGLAQQLYDEAAPHATDYELLRICGPSPEGLLESLAVAVGAINDAPLDDLEMEDEVHTPARVRAYEAAQLGSGYRLYRIVARHRETGEIAGHSVVAVDSETPENGDQHDTSVVGAHRGHRLGQLLKADMMRWLAEAEPQLATIDTWNMASNNHMVGINERMGYRIMGRELAYQRRLPDQWRH